MAPLPSSPWMCRLCPFSVPIGGHECLHWSGIASVVIKTILCVSAVLSKATSQVVAQRAPHCKENHLKYCQADGPQSAKLSSWGNVLGCSAFPGLSLPTYMSLGCSEAQVQTARFSVQWSGKFHYSSQQKSERLMVMGRGERI